MSRPTTDEIVERLRELTAMMKIGKTEEALKELKQLRRDVTMNDEKIYEKIAIGVLLLLTGIILFWLLYMR